MLAQVEIEEKQLRQEREQSAAQRRERNALAIAEVVGRNPIRHFGTPANFLSRPRDRKPNQN
jgi:hypothetical protein